MRDAIRKAYLAQVTDRFVKGQMSRRDFLSTATKLGLGASVSARPE